MSADGCRLKTAVWEFTLACNLHCSHCGSSAGRARPDELSTPECYRLCEELAALGCENICLMGGEPFQRRDWHSVGECVRDLGIRLSMVSNGLLVDRNVDRLAGLEPAVVGVSLDGLEPAHDSIRGKGTFRSAAGALEALENAGLQATVITTVSKLNFRDLPGMKELIAGMGINWQIQVAMPFGNFPRKNLLSKREYYAVALFIASLRVKCRFPDMPVMGAHCFGYRSRFLPGCPSWDGCTAGRSSLGITSNGGIVGCLSMGNHRFIEGTIRKRAIGEIWEGDSFAYNRNFTRNDLGPNCRDCRSGARCRGGCNSMSCTITGRFHNDPYCFQIIENELGIRP